ncbi:hypothetical protein BDZ90DRAFT_262670 [Jaminaea rosea]|uniref:Uncharacterized protein n=1 Tax=Jaminaea rosea TaxID=1569628 RepID=A0A316UMS4_9BASI|nr:hypothetical protein BDZ90DRAFT_262670 [Jaminaea rosea]PWN25223.1 hypothetical protein BDZ90DRAFT_262670 [Jaminaea rosea]
MSDNAGNKDEQQFSIQPHPATTNDPSTDPALTGKGGQDATGKPGPFIPDDEMASKLEKPKSSDELKAASAKLNE